MKLISHTFQSHKHSVSLQHARFASIRDRSHLCAALLVSTYAQNEQNFNAVERILYYTELPSEGAATTPNDPPPTWPHLGEIAFKNVEMAYRPGLPLVLKGVSFYVKPGEKVTAHLS